MHTVPELTATWRNDLDKFQPFDEDLQVIQTKAGKRKLPAVAGVQERDGRYPAILEGLSKPLVYHRGTNLHIALQTLVQLLQESRAIASAIRPGDDANDLNFAIQEAASAWKNFVLPLAWINRPRAVQSQSATLSENERNARRAVDDQLLALASAKQKCLDYVRIIFEEREEQRRSVIRGANIRFDKSLAELSEFATLSAMVDRSLEKSIKPVVGRMVEVFGSGKPFNTEGS